MKPFFSFVLRLPLLSALTLPLPAQAVYKCLLHGQWTYADLPCDGAALTVRPSPSSPSPSADPLTREKAEVRRMQTLREQRERQDQQLRDLHARGAAAQARKCKSLALQLRWREEDLRDAPLAAQQKARVRARRAAEKYQNDCQ